jgi:hypothetical protein
MPLLKLDKINDEYQVNSRKIAKIETETLSSRVNLPVIRKTAILYEFK